MNKTKGVKLIKIRVCILIPFVFIISANSNIQAFSQFCDENVEPSAPWVNFTINTDGTVTDNTSTINVDVVFFWTGI